MIIENRFANFYGIGAVRNSRRYSISGKRHLRTGMRAMGEVHEPMSHSFVLGTLTFDVEY
jgi:hypothetical protein